jgi:ferredoxin-thioredoxin reductase catalytic subunit
MVRLNKDASIVAAIREGLNKKYGHCPCKREISDDTKCMCKEFREQIADPNYEGYCHCMLYYKENDKNNEKK